MFATDTSVHVDKARCEAPITTGHRAKKGQTAADYRVDSLS